MTSSVTFTCLIEAPCGKTSASSVEPLQGIFDPQGTNNSFSSLANPAANYGDALVSGFIIIRATYILPAEVRSEDRH